MSYHALHSPNLTEAELNAYLQTPARPRHRRSLLDVSEHDPYLLRFLSIPMSTDHVDEIVLGIESIIDVPYPGLDAPMDLLPTPPITPIKRFKPVGRQVQVPRLPAHLRVNFCPLWSFVCKLIDQSSMLPVQLIYVVVLITRFKEAMPYLSAEELSPFGIWRDPKSRSGFVALPCTHHRIALGIIMVSQKYLNDVAIGNKRWYHFSEGIFDKPEILQLELQLIYRIDRSSRFKLFVSDQDLIEHYYRLIYPSNDCRSRVHPEKLKRIEDFVQKSAAVIPLTPITPHKAEIIDPLVLDHAPAPSPSHARVSTPALGALSEPCEVKPVLVVEKSFVLQPVPAEKKRGLKEGFIFPSFSIPLSHASWNLALHPSPPPLPLSHSSSSDVLLRVVDSYAMDEAPASSSNTGTSMTSAPTSISATSSVHTPMDRSESNLSSTQSTSSMKSRSRHRRSTLNVLDGPLNSKAMDKLHGVDGSLLMPPRGGHHDGRRTVSTATIIPDMIRLQI